MIDNRILENFWDKIGVKRMDDIKDVIQKYLELIPLDNAISRPEAEKRASQFLIAQAHLNETLMDLRMNLIAATTQVNAVYARELGKAGGKTITENKVTAEASIPYVEAREKLETINANIDYFKTYSKIFNDGHILHRNVGKNDNG